MVKVKYFFLEMGKVSDEQGLISLTPRFLKEENHPQLPLCIAPGNQMGIEEIKKPAIIVNVWPVIRKEPAIKLLVNVYLAEISNGKIVYAGFEENGPVYKYRQHVAYN